MKKFPVTKLPISRLLIMGAQLGLTYENQEHLTPESIIGAGTSVAFIAHNGRIIRNGGRGSVCLDLNGDAPATHGKRYTYVQHGIPGRVAQKRA
jgi:hypothetical protein